jgi:hypothetical protein
MDVSKFIRFSLLFLFGFHQNVSAVVFELDNTNFDEVGEVVTILGTFIWVSLMTIFW